MTSPSEWLEGWFERAYHVRPIGSGGYIMRFGLIRHRGRRVVLSDGTVVAPGDTVGELHMDNTRAAELHREGSGGIRLRREMLRMLPALGVDLATNPEYRAVQAVCGASLFWEEAAFIGFENRPLPAFERWWLTWWERFLMARYHPEGKKRLAEGNRSDLRQVWITRKKLTEYAERAARKAEAAAAVRSAGDAPPG